MHSFRSPGARKLTRFMATLERDGMLREAEPKDAEAIGKVRVAAWRAAYRTFMPEAFLSALDPANNLSELKERLSNQHSDFIVSVAEKSRDVVAFSIVGKPRYEAPRRNNGIVGCECSTRVLENGYWFRPC